MLPGCSVSGVAVSLSSPCLIYPRLPNFPEAADPPGQPGSFCRAFSSLCSPHEVHNSLIMVSRCAISGQHCPVPTACPAALCPLLPQCCSGAITPLLEMEVPKIISTCTLASRYNSGAASCPQTSTSHTEGKAPSPPSLHTVFSCNSSHLFLATLVIPKDAASSLVVSTGDGSEGTWAVFPA